MSSRLISTALGAVVVTIKEVPKYGVEDIIRDRAYSQAMSIQFMRDAQAASPNDAVGARTIGTVYTSNDLDEELV